MGTDHLNTYILLKILQYVIIKLRHLTQADGILGPEVVYVWQTFQISFRSKK